MRYWKQVSWTISIVRYCKSALSIASYWSIDISVSSQVFDFTSVLLDIFVSAISPHHVCDWTISSSRTTVYLIFIINNRLSPLEPTCDSVHSRPHLLVTTGFVVEIGKSGIFLILRGFLNTEFTVGLMFKKDIDLWELNLIDWITNNCPLKLESQDAPLLHGKGETQGKLVQSLLLFVYC